MSPATLISVVLFAGDLLYVEAELANLVPAVAVAELNFGVEGRAIVEHFGQVSCAMGLALAISMASLRVICSLRF
jgi:hypothetical protein